MPYIPDETVPQPGQYGPLALAFVGDGVYELYVRTRLMRARTRLGTALKGRLKDEA